MRESLVICKCQKKQLFGGKWCERGHSYLVERNTLVRSYLPTPLLLYGAPILPIMLVRDPLSALIIQGRFPGRGKVIFSGFGHFALLAEPARAGFVAECTEIMDVANRQG